MGRRAKKAPVQTKKRVKLSKRFKCPFCANEDTVECKMDFRAGVGSLNCRLCAAAYQMPIHHLHEPIDVFSEWLDDCEAAANPGRQDGSEGVPRYQDEDEEEDDIPEGSGLAQISNERSSPKSSSHGGGQRETYETLGLDDSDDNDEEHYR
jgi:transcription elongation factor Elf1